MYTIEITKLLHKDGVVKKIDAISTLAEGEYSVNLPLQFFLEPPTDQFIPLENLTLEDILSWIPQYEETVETVLIEKLDLEKSLVALEGAFLPWNS